ncbi:MAG TPA: isochorismatase family protein [Vicinamibacterales bacterium]
MATDRASALLIVDVQKDFCPGGALPVGEGERVVAVLNQHIADALARGWPVYASRDWHPAVTRHFKDYGGDWPRHCVRNTAGAAFHDDLQLPASTIVVSKGQDAESHGYSAFEGQTSEGLSLLSDLKARRIGHLYVGGLATDYCVKHSVLDALHAGLTVTLLRDAIAGVNLQPEDSARAITAMQEAGADIEARA